MTDIVDRLRESAHDWLNEVDTRREAADEIERLRAERDAWEGTAQGHYKEAFALRARLAAAEEELDQQARDCVIAIREAQDRGARVSFLSSLCVRAVVEGWTESQVMAALTADADQPSVCDHPAGATVPDGDGWKCLDCGYSTDKGADQPSVCQHKGGILQIDVCAICNQPMTADKGTADEPR